MREEPMLTTGQVAKRVPQSRTTILRWCRCGIVEAEEPVRPNHEWKIPLSSAMDVWPAYFTAKDREVDWPRCSDSSDSSDSQSSDLFSTAESSD